MNEAAKVIDHPAARRDDKVYNYQLTFVCGKNSVQGQFLTDFPQSLSETELAEKMDMLDRLARRQQARYELDELERARETEEVQIAEWQRQLGEAEEAHQKLIAELDRKIARGRAAQGDVANRAKAEHGASGRRGDFELRGEPKKQVTQYEREIAQAEGEKQKQEAERAAAISNLKINIRTAEKSIATITAKIDAKRRTLEGPKE